MVVLKIRNCQPTISIVYTHPWIISLFKDYYCERSSKNEVVTFLLISNGSISEDWSDEQIRRTDLQR